MANLKEVRNRIASASSTQQITKAMKMVSAAKLKRASTAITQLRPYADKLNQLLTNLYVNSEDLENSLMQEREPKRVLLIPISSNRGLAGAFNANIIKATTHLITSTYAAQYQERALFLITIGKKVQDYFQKRGYEVLANYHQIFAALSYKNVSELTHSILQAYHAGDYDRVELIYTRFKNAANQEVIKEQLLPIKFIRPIEQQLKTHVDYIVEPSKHEVLEELAPQLVKIKLYQALLDSHASEHGARMIAMDKATENAGELIRALKLSYNQARQAAITTELSEIVSGGAALSKR